MLISARKNTGCAAVAEISLALGIGANTAIFSVVSAVLLQPLPYRDSDRLLSISQVDRQNKVIGIPVSHTKFTQIQEQNRTLESTAAYYVLGLALATNTDPE